MRVWCLCVYISARFTPSVKSNSGANLSLVVFFRSSLWKAFLKRPSVRFADPARPDRTHKFRPNNMRKSRRSGDQNGPHLWRKYEQSNKWRKIERICPLFGRFSSNILTYVFSVDPTHNLPVRSGPIRELLGAATVDFVHLFLVSQSNLAENPGEFRQ